jgi:hypothetical protein
MNNQYLSNTEAEVLNNLSPGNQLLGFGSKLQQALANTFGIGKKWFLDPVNGNDSNDGLSPETAFKTLPIAYAALTTNENETLYVIGGASSLALSTAFEWAKSYTHMVGLASNLRFGGRARITHSANFATMFTISGSGCIFHNIHWQGGRGSTTNVTCVSITGLRNSFTSCHFEAMLHATEAGGTQSWRAVSIGDAAQANSFIRCTFGSWTTVWASANGKLVNFVGDNADTHFDDCLFVGNTTSADMKFVGFTGPISGGQSVITFNNCRFINTNTGITVLSETPSNGSLLFSMCTGFGFTNYSAAAATVFVASPTMAKAGGLGQNPT